MVAALSTHGMEPMYERNNSNYGSVGQHNFIKVAILNPECIAQRLKT